MPAIFMAYWSVDLVSVSQNRLGVTHPMNSTLLLPPMLSCTGKHMKAAKLMHTWSIGLAATMILQVLQGLLTFVEGNMNCITAEVRGELARDRAGLVLKLKIKNGPRAVRHMTYMRPVCSSNFMSCLFVCMCAHWCTRAHVGSSSSSSSSSYLQETRHLRAPVHSLCGAPARTQLRDDGP